MDDEITCVNAVEDQVDGAVKREIFIFPFGVLWILLSFRNRKAKVCDRISMSTTLFLKFYTILQS